MFGFYQVGASFRREPEPADLPKLFVSVSLAEGLLGVSNYKGAFEGARGAVVCRSCGQKGLFARLPQPGGSPIQKLGRLGGWVFSAMPPPGALRADPLEIFPHHDTEVGPATCQPLFIPGADG